MNGRGFNIRLPFKIACTFRIILNPGNVRANKTISKLRAAFQNFSQCVEVTCKIFWTQ